MSRALEPSTVRGTANAPRGAMQFELTDTEGLPEDVPPYFWVMPKERADFIGSSCKNGHELMYPVIVEMLPEFLRKMAEVEMKRNGTAKVGVCECSGRIIE